MAIEDKELQLTLEDKLEQLQSEVDSKLKQIAVLQQKMLEVGMETVEAERVAFLTGVRAELIGKHPEVARLEEIQMENGSMESVIVCRPVIKGDIVRTSEFFVITGGIAFVVSGYDHQLPVEKIDLKALLEAANAVAREGRKWETYRYDRFWSGQEVSGTGSYGGINIYSLDQQGGQYTFSYDLTRAVQAAERQLPTDQWEKVLARIQSAEENKNPAL